MSLQVKEGVKSIPRQHPHPLELGIHVVCNACGHIVEASWVARDAPIDRQIVLVVEKCRCDSPLQRQE